jgi:drug/metabolite transporter (DMT)-like permease
MASPAIARARPLAHWGLLLALSSMWGSSFLMMKIAVAALPPSAVASGRLVLAAAVLGAVVAVSGRRLPRSPRAWGFFLAMAVVGNAVPFWLIAFGQQSIDSGLAGILMAVMPLTTIVLAHFLVDGERLTGAKAGGFVLGFLGIVVLMGPEALRGLGGPEPIAQLAVLSAAICYACNSIIARRRPQDGDAVMAATVVMGIGAVLMLPLGLPAMPRPVDVPLASALALLALGVISTALATVVYFKLIAAAGPSFLSLINYLIPLIAVVLGMIALGERPEPNALVALGLILAGIALAELRGRRASAGSGHP